jgi:hypothetical protein
VFAFGGNARAQAGAPLPTESVTQAKSPIPMLAYYYIWFDPSSWSRAKKDLPQLGPYSSGDEAVIRQHILWAKAAGLQGFIVSWKSTDTLDQRLETLIKIADEQNFKLAIIYEGLDFSRQPLPVDKVAADLALFAQKYASDPAFSLFAKPLVIWSGTWNFSVAEVQQVTQPLRDKLLILASEKNTRDYQSKMAYVDGDAYYWSSVNPDTNANYENKLAGMGAAVHANYGLWIAPAAAGFDARLIGGSTVVERSGGNTLIKEIGAALASAPDAVGIISWNEFSENSHIEPSQAYGMQYLDVLAKASSLPAPPVADFDSSAQPTEAPATIASSDPGLEGNIFWAFGILGAVFLVSLGVLVWRQFWPR